MNAPVPIRLIQRFQLPPTTRMLWQAHNLASYEFPHGHIRVSHAGKRAIMDMMPLVAPEGRSITTMLGTSIVIDEDVPDDALDVAVQVWEGYPQP